MSDAKTISSAYTRLGASHPYLLLSNDQFALLDDNMNGNVIQYDHMYVQTTHILLVRWTNKNCYVNIIEHAAADIITSTCDFSYYHKITAHATLVTTNDFFYLLNIQDEIKITCEKYNRESVCETHSVSVSIIKRQDVCDCVIQTTEIQLIGSQSNCSSNGNFIIYHTFNFITEWLSNKFTMPYYRKKEHILTLPGQSKLPAINVLQSNTSDVFTEQRVSVISIHQLDSLVNNLETDIFLNGEVNSLLNHSLELNMDDNEDLLDIDSWFDEDAESSMIFIFVSFIVALIAFIFLLFLCFKHKKLRRFMSLYVASPQAAASS